MGTSTRSWLAMPTGSKRSCVTALDIRYMHERNSDARGCGTRLDKHRNPRRLSDGPTGPLVVCLDFSSAPCSSDPFSRTHCGSDCHLRASPQHGGVRGMFTGGSPGAGSVDVLVGIDGSPESLAALDGVVLLVDAELHEKGALGTNERYEAQKKRLEIRASDKPGSSTSSCRWHQRSSTNGPERSMRRRSHGGRQWPPSAGPSTWSIPRRDPGNRRLQTEPGILEEAGRPSARSIGSRCQGEPWLGYRVSF
jgi:hypothetical protein